MTPFYTAETFCTDHTWYLEVYLLRLESEIHSSFPPHVGTFLLVIPYDYVRYSHCGEPWCFPEFLMTLPHWIPSERLLKTLRGTEYESEYHLEIIQITSSGSFHLSKNIAFSYTVRLMLATQFFKTIIFSRNIVCIQTQTHLYTHTHTADLWTKWVWTLYTLLHVDFLQ